jgi:hypothetical protein
MLYNKRYLHNFSMKLAPKYLPKQISSSVNIFSTNIFS